MKLQPVAEVWNIKYEGCSVIIKYIVLTGNTICFSKSFKSCKLNIKIGFAYYRHIVKSI